MSELKRCPFCGIEFVIEEDRGHKYYTHPHVGCFFDYLPILIDDEDTIRKWNTRKPMERIIERLEEEKACCQHYDINGKLMSEETARKNGISKAIKIVKEEGGSHD